MIHRLFSLLLLVILAAACAASQRANDAAIAKVHMVGMSKEDVLSCMGPAKKKAHEGATEVWSYESTSVVSNWGSTHSKNFCIVNIVLKNNAVSAVNYSGPTSTSFAPDEQCGYAVENCVKGSRF